MSGVEPPLFGDNKQIALLYICIAVAMLFAVTVYCRSSATMQLKQYDVTCFNGDMVIYQGVVRDYGASRDGYSFIEMETEKEYKFAPGAVCLGVER